MKIRNVALATAALALAASPAIAEATFERSNAPITGESEVQGTPTVLIAVLAAAAVVAGAVVIADNDDEPTSP